MRAQGSANALGYIYAMNDHFMRSLQGKYDVIYDWPSLMVLIPRAKATICCTVACALVVECPRAYAKMCLMYHVKRHVASTSGRSMTNGANYKRGKLHHSPWHSDIRTSNQHNTSPGRLSHPFQTKTLYKREEEAIKQRGSPQN